MVAGMFAGGVAVDVDRERGEGVCAGAGVSAGACGVDEPVLPEGDAQVFCSCKRAALPKREGELAGLTGINELH